MFENPRRGRQARDFTTNVPKILDLKSSSEEIFSENCRWVPPNCKKFAQIIAHKLTLLKIRCIIVYKNSLNRVFIRLTSSVSKALPAAGLKPKRLRRVINCHEELN